MNALSADAVASIRAQSETVHLIVVDNASVDGSAALAAELADVVCAQDENRGFAAGVNVGLSHCTEPYVLLLNPDACLSDGALARFVQVLDMDPNVGAVGGLLVGEHGETFGARRFSSVSNRLLALMPLARRWRHGKIGPEYPRRGLGRGLFTVDYLWGAALLVRRSVMERTRGLDERFFLYSEDEDLARSIRQSGMTSVLAAGARVAHVGGESTGGDDALALARLGHALVIGFGKWDGRPASLAFAAGFIIVLGLRLLRALVVRESGAARREARAFRVFVALLAGAHPRGSFGRPPASNCVTPQG